MASASGVRAGAAFVELFVKDAALVKGLNAATKRLKSWGSSVTSLGKELLTGGTAAMAPLLAAGKIFADMGSQLNDASLRTGVSVEALSELGYAGQLSGVDLESLQGSLTKMQRTLAAAAGGSQTAQEALASLGLTAESLSRLSPDQQFTALGNAISRLPDATQRTAAALAVFGKSGAKLLPLFAGGAAGIAAMRQEAGRLGLVMSTADAEAADAFGDTLDTLWARVKMTAFVIGAQLAPDLTDLAKRAIGLLKTFADWAKQNQQLIVTIFKVAAGVAAAGAVLIPLGGLLSMLGTMLAGIAAGTATIAAGLLAIGPPLLAIAAATGIVGGVAYATGTAAEAIKYLAGVFGTLRDEVQKTWQGITDALGAGDITLAAKILWNALKLAWVAGTAELKRLWLDFKEGFFALVTAVGYGAAELLTQAWAAVKRTWVSTLAFMAKAFIGLGDEIAASWNGIQGWLMKRMIDMQVALGRIPQAAAEFAKTGVDVAIAGQNATERRRSDAKRAGVDLLTAADIAAIDRDTADSVANLERDKHRSLVENARDRQGVPPDPELQRLRAEQDALLKEAAEKRAAAVEISRRGPEAVDEDLAVPDPRDVQKDVERRLSTAGTFSAAAAMGMGTGSTADRIATATEETAKQVRKLREENREQEGWDP